MPYRDTSTQERKRAARLYDAGLSSREVAELVGCSPQSVLSWADLYGDGRREQAEARAAASWTDDKIQRAKDLGWMYVKLRSVRKVTGRVELCRRTVMRHLKSKYNPFPYPLSQNEELNSHQIAHANGVY
jgi:transposase